MLLPPRASSVPRQRVQPLDVEGFDGRDDFERVVSTSDSLMGRGPPPPPGSPIARRRRRRHDDVVVHAAADCRCLPAGDARTTDNAAHDRAAHDRAARRPRRPTTVAPTTVGPSTTSAEPSTSTPVEPTTSIPIPTTVPETSVPESSTTTSSTTTTTVVPVANVNLVPLCTSVGGLRRGNADVPCRQQQRTTGRDHAAERRHRRVG